MVVEVGMEVVDFFVEERRCGRQSTTSAVVSEILALTVTCLMFVCQSVPMGPLGMILNPALDMDSGAKGFNKTPSIR
jgi:hypothetical protein